MWQAEERCAQTVEVKPFKVRGHFHRSSSQGKQKERNSEGRDIKGGGKWEGKEINSYYNNNYNTKRHDVY